MENVQNVEIVKVVNVGETYTAKNGKKYTNVNYYVVFNGTWCAIRPSFKNGYKMLDLLARKVTNSGEASSNEHKK